MNTYDKGDIVTLTATITNASNVATDPTTLTFKIKAGPNGSVTTYVYGTNAELVKSSTGVYYVAWPVATAGVVHYYQFVATGTAASASEGSFDVRATEF